jgi:hypothetical protein
MLNVYLLLGIPPFPNQNAFTQNTSVYFLMGSGMNNWYFSSIDIQTCSLKTAVSDYLFFAFFMSINFFHLKFGDRKFIQKQT